MPVAGLFVEGVVSFQLRIHTFPLTSVNTFPLLHHNFSHPSFQTEVSLQGRIFNINKTTISGLKPHNFVGAVQPSAEADGNGYS